MVSGKRLGRCPRISSHKTPSLMLQPKCLETVLLSGPGLQPLADLLAAELAPVLLETRASADVVAKFVDDTGSNGRVARTRELDGLVAYYIKLDLSTLQAGLPKDVKDSLGKGLEAAEMEMKTPKPRRRPGSAC